MSKRELSVVDRSETSVNVTLWGDQVIIQIFHLLMFISHLKTPLFNTECLVPWYQALAWHLFSFTMRWTHQSSLKCYRWLYCLALCSLAWLWNYVLTVPFLRFVLHSFPLILLTTSQWLSLCFLFFLQAESFEKHVNSSPVIAVKGAKVSDFGGERFI